MIRRPPRSTRTDTLFPYTTLFRSTGIPSFAPELLQRVRPSDPMRMKHLARAVEQLAEEGAAKAFKTRLGSQWIVGVVGDLQLEVLADRIRTEYDVPVTFETAGRHTSTEERRVGKESGSPCRSRWAPEH